jgi:hypothetical protein
MKGNLVAFSMDGFGKFATTGNIDGNTGFDTDLPSPGTMASSSGNSFNVIGNTHDTTATYSDAIKLSIAAMPERDLYRRLRVEFNGRVDTKWSQRPLPTRLVGENIHSDIDWRRATTPNGDRQAAADDFRSDGRPITGVRWWGSYFNPNDQPKPDPINQNLVPPIEEGYVISFFETISDIGPVRLLGTYVAPTTVVDIKPTGFAGWDQHDVWEYVVDLDQTLLEHASDLATKEAFLERPGAEYWISIAAEDGHEINLETGDIVDTGDPQRTAPWWGWHTTPERGNDQNFVDGAPLIANVSMDGLEWVYAPWETAPQFHCTAGQICNNLAFELLTVDGSTIGLNGITDTMMNFVADTDTVVVPEPPSFVLLAGAVLFAFGRMRALLARRCG